jgi:cytoskeletal protein CcmA (bactofilin family)
MTDLTGTLISNTYKDLLQVNSSASNGGITTSLTNVQSGNGVNTALNLATNQAKIDGNLEVAGTICASTYYGDGSNLTDITASITGDICVGSISAAGNLFVSGTTSITGAVQLKSTVTVSGAAVFKSTATVSGNSGFLGTLRVAGATSLEGAVVMSDTATVSGAAGFLSTVRVSGNTTIGGTLDVLGNVCLGGNVTVKGDVHVSSKVCASAFFGDGSNITGIPISGNISVGNATIAGNLYVSGTTSITGAAVLKSTATVSGNVGFLGTARVAGATSLEGAVVMADTATVSGNAGFLGTVRVAGATSLEAAVVMSDTATVSGAAGFLGTVRVSGNTTIGGTLDVLGNVCLGGNVTVKGDVHVSSKVCASAFFGDGSNITGIPISGNISVGNATIGGTLYVGSTATVSGNAAFLGQIALSESAAASVHTTAINGVASVSLNFGTGQNFLTTVTAAHTMARPTNARVGQVGSVFFVQSGGSGTLSWNAAWKFPAGTDPTFSTSSGAVDRLDYIVASISSDNSGENIQAILSQEYG